MSLMPATWRSLTSRLPVERYTDTAMLSMGAVILKEPVLSSSGGIVSLVAMLKRRALLLQTAAG